MKRAKFFRNEPEAKLKCGACENIAQDARQHDTCGTLFCSNCCEDCSSCPSCKSPNAKFHNDGKSKSLLNTKSLLCSFDKSIAHKPYCFMTIALQVKEKLGI